MTLNRDTRAVDAYRDKLRDGFMTTVIEASIVDNSDGTRTAAIISGDVVDELLNVMALLIHSSVDCATPSKTRATCDVLARKLQRRVAAVKGTDTSFMTTIHLDDPQ
jgi:hypothetical protein